jgi:hypothetical protein
MYSNITFVILVLIDRFGTIVLTNQQIYNATIPALTIRLQSCWRDIIHRLPSHQVIGLDIIGLDITCPATRLERRWFLTKTITRRHAIFRLADWLRLLGSGVE